MLAGGRYVSTLCIQHIAQLAHALEDEADRSRKKSTRSVGINLDVRSSCIFCVVLEHKVLEAVAELVKDLVILVLGQVKTAVCQIAKGHQLYSVSNTCL